MIPPEPWMMPAKLFWPEVVPVRVSVCAPRLTTPAPLDAYKASIDAPDMVLEISKEPSTET